MSSFINYLSPIGNIIIRAEGDSLSGLWFEGQRSCPSGYEETLTENPELSVLEETTDWLDRYFAGKRPSGRELKLWPAEGDFQRGLREILLDIPYGQTLSYSQAALKMHESCGYSPSCCRAVGNALGKNPISIIVPCHRIVAAGGTGGYAGGIERKLFLLRHESEK